MKAAACIFVLSLFVSASATAQFMTGEALFSDSKQYLAINRSSTVMNFQDAAELGGYVKGILDSNHALRDCLPNRITEGQISSIVAKYVVAHDEIRHLTGNQLVILSMIEAFPKCKQTFSSDKKE